MPTRYLSTFPERTMRGSKSAKPNPGGQALNKPAAVTERTADWPKLARGGSGFNRATKMPVVKTAPAKAGLP